LDVGPAEVGRLPISSHKLVEYVDTLHVMHDTESEVCEDVASAIHPAGDCAHEILNLGLVALSTSSKVLACKLGDPDVPVEGGMEILAIADELLRISAIPMYANKIHGTAIAIRKELLQPNFATRPRGDGGRNEAVAMALEGLEVLLPEGSSVTGIKVRLAINIGFVEA